MSSDIAIKVDNLSKCYQIYDRPQDRLKQMVMGKFSRNSKRYYREFWALKDVSFEVKKGQTVGIIGRNGSGKSTLLQMICGTLNPTSGSVTTQGRVAALLELGSGFNPEFTGRENVYLNASVLGLSQAETAQRFDNIASFADIGEFIDQPVKTYSSGMMLRLAFGVIAHVDADILVIDEALAVGDAFFTQKCMRFLRKFMQTNTVLFVSHDTGSIKGLCSEAVWLDKGQVKVAGGVENVTKEYNASILNQFADYSSHQIKIEKTHNPAIQHIQNREAIGTSTVELFDNIAFSDGWKTGAAEITAVTMLDPETHHTVATYEGGERVTFQIEAKTNDPLSSPILGFYIKDRTGQSLFGEHTYTYMPQQLETQAGDTLRASFTFTLPYLPDGVYAATVSIASGNPYVHTQHHWLHDAVVFKVQSSKLRHGLVGILFEKVEFEIVAP
jgi:lipopolysaccharide transport system ATP-binding protein